MEAVLFDFDGVIADSERLHWAAFKQTLEPIGITLSWEDYRQKLMGFDDRGAFQFLLPEQSLHELERLVGAKAQAFLELLSENGGAAALPGVVELIRSLSGTLPIAICSGALRSDIDPILLNLGIDKAFDAMVTADDTPVSKPDPAPYRLTCRKLGVTSGLAIEDTPAGIRSAKGAGLHVLAVTNSYPIHLLMEADAVIDTLEDLTPDDLHSIYAKMTGA